MKKRLIIFALSSFLWAESLSLKEVMSQTLQNNIDIKLSESSIKQAENSATILSSGKLPTLALSMSSAYSNGEAENFGIVGDVDKTQSALGLQLSYNVFDGFYTTNNHKIAKKQVDIKKLSADMSREQILLTVAQTYVTLHSTSKNIAVLKEAVELSKERVELEQLRVARGVTGRVFKKAVIDLATDSTSLLDAEANYNKILRNLNFLMGRDGREEIITSDIEFIELPSVEELKDEAIKKSTTIKSQNSLTEISELTKKVAQSAFYPRISLNTSYGLNHSNNDFGIDFDKDAYGIFSAGVSLKWNIFDGRALGIYDNTKRKISDSKLLLEKSKISIRNSIDNSYESYNNNLIALKRSRKNLKLIDWSLEKTKKLYKAGSVDGTSYRETQIMKIRAETSIIITEGNAKLAELTMLSLSGRLLK